MAAHSAGTTQPPPPRRKDASILAHQQESGDPGPLQCGLRGFCEGIQSARAIDLLRVSNRRTLGHTAVAHALHAGAHRSCDTARGAETHAWFKQYECWANSSLVLTTDSWPRPTSNPETLWGLIDKKSFGTVPCRPSTLSLTTGSPNPASRWRWAWRHQRTEQKELALT